MLGFHVLIINSGLRRGLEGHGGHGGFHQLFFLHPEILGMYQYLSNRLETGKIFFRIISKSFHLHDSSVHVRGDLVHVHGDLVHVHGRFVHVRERNFQMILEIIHVILEIFHLMSM